MQECVCLWAAGPFSADTETNTLASCADLLGTNANRSEYGFGIDENPITALSRGKNVGTKWGIN